MPTVPIRPRSRKSQGVTCARISKHRTACRNGDLHPMEHTTRDEIDVSQKKKTFGHTSKQSQLARAWSRWPEKAGLHWRNDSIKPELLGEDSKCLADLLGDLSFAESSCAKLRIVHGSVATLPDERLDLVLLRWQCLCQPIGKDRPHCQWQSQQNIGRHDRSRFLRRLQDRWDLDVVQARNDWTDHDS